MTTQTTEVTNEQLDGLVAEWHSSPDDGQTLEVFMAGRLGWKASDVEHWITDQRYRP